MVKESDNDNYDYFAYWVSTQMPQGDITQLRLKLESPEYSHLNSEQMMDEITGELMKVWDKKAVDGKHGKASKLKKNFKEFLEKEVKGERGRREYVKGEREDVSTHFIYNNPYKTGQAQRRKQIDLSRIFYPYVGRKTEEISIAPTRLSGSDRTIEVNQRSLSPVVKPSGEISALERNTVTDRMTNLINNLEKKGDFARADIETTRKTINLLMTRNLEGEDTAINTFNLYKLQQKIEGIEMHNKNIGKTRLSMKSNDELRRALELKNIDSTKISDAALRGFAKSKDIGTRAWDVNKEEIIDRISKKTKYGEAYKDALLKQKGNEAELKQEYYKLFPFKPPRQKTFFLREKNLPTTDEEVAEAFKRENKMDLIDGDLKRRIERDVNIRFKSLSSTARSEEVNKRLVAEALDKKTLEIELEKRWMDSLYGNRDRIPTRDELRDMARLDDKEFGKLIGGEATGKLTKKTKKPVRKNIIPTKVWKNVKSELQTKYIKLDQIARYGQELKIRKDTLDKFVVPRVGLGGFGEEIEKKAPTQIKEFVGISGVPKELTDIDFDFKNT